MGVVCSNLCANNNEKSNVVLDWSSTIDKVPNAEAESVMNDIFDKSKDIEKNIRDYAKKRSDNLTGEVDNIKKNFEAKVNNYAKMLGGKINELIAQKNPHAKNVQLSEEIIKKKIMSMPNDLFYMPMILFPSDEIYEGFWNKKEQKHGFGICLFPDGRVFKGFFLNDKIGDYGALVESSGSFYVGQFSAQKPEGQGESCLPQKFSFKGSFRNGVPEGKGTLENFEDGSLYIGEMFGGKKDGVGCQKFADGSIYNGTFKEGRMEGRGKLNFNNGDIYEGEFTNNKMNGKGKFTWNDGKYYTGEYKDDKKSGYGEMFWNQNQYYKGFWLNNYQHGEGVFYYNGKEINGFYRFGKLIKTNNVEKT